MTGDAPVVLDEQSGSPVVNVASGVAGKQAAIRGRTCKEVFDWRRSNAAVRGRESVAAEKFEASTRSTIGAAAETIAMLFETEFNNVLSDRAGDVIHKLIAVVR